MERTSGNPWIDYTDGDGFSGDVEHIFETHKEMYLVDNIRRDTWVDETHYYDVKHWDDGKTPDNQVYGINHKILDSSGDLVTDDDPGDTPVELEYSDYAGFSGRNPLFLLAKGCCSDSLKVERRYQGPINEVRVSCNDSS